MGIKYKYVIDGQVFQCETFDDLENYHDIVWLDCTGNDLSCLPILPAGLNTLYCDNNRLSGLPTLPIGLKYLDCSKNLLTVLPTLPNSLEYIYCFNNKLSVLPTLPNSLITLWCFNNQLSVLPTLTNSLITLNCSHNKIILLPTLPNSLDYLNCDNNLLAFLPKFRGNLKFKYYVSNPVVEYIEDKCDDNLKIYHRINEIFSLKLVRWYLDCRENPVYKFCRDRLNKEYDALIEEDTGGIMT